MKLQKDITMPAYNRRLDCTDDDVGRTDDTVGRAINDDGYSLFPASESLHTSIKL